MKPVSAWTTHVKTELDNAHFLFRKKLGGYRFDVCLSAGSLWLVAKTANKVRMAFRCAFSVLHEFKVIKSEETDEAVVIYLETALGNYRVRIEFPESNETVVHYTTAFTANRPFLLPFAPRDIVPLIQDGLIENAAGKIHLHQVGARSGQLFSVSQNPKAARCFTFRI